MITKCNQCGKDFEALTRGRKFCNICRAIRKNEVALKYYYKNHDVLLARINANQRKRRKENPEIEKEYNLRYRTGRYEPKPYKYCRNQQGIDGIGCLDCVLEECIIKEDKSDFNITPETKKRYREIKEKTWLPIDEEFKELDFDETLSGERTPIYKSRKKRENKIKIDEVGE